MDTNIPQPDKEVPDYLNEAAEKYCNEPLQGGTNFISEAFISGAMSPASARYHQSPAQPGGVWVNFPKYPAIGVTVLFDGDEQLPIWGDIKFNGKHPSIHCYDSSGEDEYIGIDLYSRWLDESSSPVHPDEGDAVEFANFLHNERWLPLDGYDRWEHEETKSATTTQQLYNLFLQSKQKQP